MLELVPHLFPYRLELGVLVTVGLELGKSVPSDVPHQGPHPVAYDPVLHGALKVSKQLPDATSLMLVLHEQVALSDCPLLAAVSLQGIESTLPDLVLELSCQVELKAIGTVHHFARLLEAALPAPLLHGQTAEPGELGVHNLAESRGSAASEEPEIEPGHEAAHEGDVLPILDHCLVLEAEITVAIECSQRLDGQAPRVLDGGLMSPTLSYSTFAHIPPQGLQACVEETHLPAPKAKLEVALAMEVPLQSPEGPLHYLLPLVIHVSLDQVYLHVACPPLEEELAPPRLLLLLLDGLGGR